MSSHAIRPRVRAGALLALGLLGIAALVGGSTGTASAAVTPTPSVLLVPTGRTGPDIMGTHWQGVASFTFTAGQTAQFLHEDCPAMFPHVASGAYAFNNVGQVTTISVGFNGPRIDENPAFFGEWGWEFYFPSGAPAGMSALFSIDCVK